MKKYQRYIVCKKMSDHPHTSDLREFYVRVEQRDGEWVAASDAMEIPTDGDPVQHFVLLTDIGQIGEAPREDGLVPVTPPDGYTVLAQHWLPDNFVPPSFEVREEERRRGAEAMKVVMKQISDFREGKKNNG